MREIKININGKDEALSIYPKRIKAATKSAT